MTLFYILILYLNNLAKQEYHIYSAGNKCYLHEYLTLFHTFIFKDDLSANFNYLLSHQPGCIIKKYLFKG